ncbi:hypothetical protein B0T22DRAFT_445007 [Podospora appendiculata]|uniref:Uncharacterized protein n=1 Tax=Podospora appendiculata TaxID=314037 RepID=A0AAE0X265_9PEZI|nr:hypothetical protein B0T22DRAFT_445007 [Podospora appendiculata]
MAHLRPEQENFPLMRSPLMREKGTADVSRVPTPSTTFTQTDADEPNLEALGWRDGLNPDYPEFERHEEATNIEVFYDLFFAAILCMFAEVQDVTNISQLNTFIAYFVQSPLVHLSTARIFERSARAAHFGVMVGFVVIVPTFSVSDQKGQTFKTMSLILMASRLAMAAQYATILWQVRKFKNTKLPLGLMVGMNTVAAVVYMGAGFGFTDGHIALFFCVVLSFSGTHLVNRMSLLTYIFIGEGIITVLSAVTKIVLNQNSWTPPTTGNVTAGIATLYVLVTICTQLAEGLHRPHKVAG